MRLRGFISERLINGELILIITIIIVITIIICNNLRVTAFPVPRNSRKTLSFVSIRHLIFFHVRFDPVARLFQRLEVASASAKFNIAIE